MEYPEEEILLLRQMLKEEKVILYPTDTVWGLGCDAQSRDAVEKIYKIKACPKDHPCLLLVSDIEMLKHYVHPIPPKASNLIQYHERPLTIIYEHLRNLPDFLLAQDGSIGIRVTQDPFCQEFVRAFGGAILSTSAHIYGQDFPKSYQEISPEIIEAVDYVAQYRQEESSQDATLSTIVRISDRNELIFVRN